MSRKSTNVFIRGKSNGVDWGLLSLSLFLSLFLCNFLSGSLSLGHFLHLLFFLSWSGLGVVYDTHARTFERERESWYTSRNEGTYIYVYRHKSLINLEQVPKNEFF